MKNKISILSKKKLIALMFVCILAMGLLVVRVFYIINVDGTELQKKALQQQTRDRLIPPQRGTIYDTNMVPIATTETVASISAVPNQVKDKEGTAKILSEELGLEYDYVYDKLNENVALVRIKTKVDKETAEEIRAMGLAGVVVDEDVKRVYPYSTMASQVIGFVGKDNQGIIGLEAKYNDYLAGSPGKIMTETDVKGKEIKNGNEVRKPPKDGYNLIISMDVVIQQYAEQVLHTVVTETHAKRGTIIVMDPNNGEVLAMANEPTFDLNDPFTINSPELEAEWEYLTPQEQSDYLNQMWRNFAINDTYEPGSTFKILTAVAGLEENIVTEDSTFFCPGYYNVAGRNIKCWKAGGHGAENFIEGVYNSCNPVFIQVAEGLGAEMFYSYLYKFGFNSKTGIDLPGEATSIMYDEKNVGPVELATMGFGQSIQVTPIQLITMASEVVNGGYKITPHFGTQIIDNEGNIIETFEYPQGEQIISTATSEIMKQILEGVVYVGTGNKTYIPGFKIGGKTATSEKLPRGKGKYIASFLAFAPADDPEVIALILVDEPQGAHYGGQIVGPVMKELYSNVLPYLGIEPKYNPEELLLPEVSTIKVPDLTGISVTECKSVLEELGISVEVIGEGELVESQFPAPGEIINYDTKIILYTN